MAAFILYITATYALTRNLLASPLEKSNADPSTRSRRESPLLSQQVPLPDKITVKINKFMKKKHFSYSRKFGTAVEFKCETKITREIFRMFPRVAYRWIHNDLPLKIEADRMVYQMGTLIIQGLRHRDTGVFVCQIEYTPGQIKSVGVYSLVVQAAPDSEVHVIESKTLKLQCHSGFLGHIYQDSKRYWKLADSKFSKDTPSKSRNADEFPNFQRNMSGKWTCMVTHPATDRLWTTALYTVVVDPPPTQLQRIIETIQSHKLYIGITGMGILLFLVVACVSLARHAERKRKKEQEELEKLTKQLATEKDIDSTYDSYDSYSDSSDDYSRGK